MKLEMPVMTLIDMWISTIRRICNFLFLINNFFSV